MLRRQGRARRRWSAATRPRTGSWSARAALKGTQDALLFPTGFAANLAVVSALACGASQG